MAEAAPLVSILIRSMDRPTLERALASAAAQTWPNLEIVVVAACGAAHRALPQEFQGRPLRLVYPEPDRRLPRPEAANAALDAAHGEWLNFLDDDDTLFPEHVHTLLAALRDDERLVYSRSEVRDEHGKVTGHCGIGGHPVRFYYDNVATPNAVLFARSLVLEGARFDTAFPVYEDYDFFVNCAARSRPRFVDAVTCTWNAHSGESGLGHGANRTETQRAQLSDQLRAKWTHVFERWAREPGALLETGHDYLKRGNHDAARDCLERALALTPQDVNALNLCGMANLRSGNVERAEALLTQALRRLPGHRALQDNLALIRAKRAAG